jgi:hypothetical protein
MGGILSRRSTTIAKVTLLALTLVAVMATERVTEACTSGLVLIPTTDTTGAYVWAVDVQWQGYSSVLKTDQLVINSEFGIGDRFEVGVDVDATSGAANRRVLLNAKYVFLQSDRFTFTMAAGTQHGSPGFEPSPYVVATKDWGVLRTHLGVQRNFTENITQWFIGVDRTFDERWQIMADYATGPGSYASAGVGWTWGRWQTVLGAQWPNDGGPALAVIHVVLTGQFGKKKG